MGLLRKTGAGILAGLLLLADSMRACAGASFYVPCYQIPEGASGNYMMLEEDFGEYEVLEGDCLWDIAEKMLGNGSEYVRLMEMNPDVLTDPDRIYPHMRLQLRQKVYVRKQADDLGTQMGQFRFGTLAGWTVGIVRSGDAVSNFAFTRRDNACIVCRVRDKEQDSVDTLSDWDAGRNAIEEYAQENYKDRVTDLAFHRYRSERGDDIYLFSYVYTIDGGQYGLKGTLSVNVTHVICQTEHIQAEFTGFAIGDSLEDVVRYLGAGFEELPPTGQEEFSVNDFNITLGPVEAWGMPGLYNPFTWIEEYFDGIFSQAVPVSPEKKSAKERILF